jgi:T-complex protein 1 subunit delta
MADLGKSQDIEAGDGTTSVVVLAGSLLSQSEKLLKRGVHPTAISEAFLEASKKSHEILEKVAIPVELSDRESLLRAATTSLSSKVVSQNSSLLAPIAVDAVLNVIDPKTATNVDLRDIRYRFLLIIYFILKHFYFVLLLHFKFFKIFIFCFAIFSQSGEEGRWDDRRHRTRRRACF